LLSIMGGNQNKLGASPQLECWNHSMRLTNKMAKKNTVIPMNCRNSDTELRGFAPIGVLECWNSGLRLVG
jgi:hypothetical protein